MKTKILFVVQGEGRGHMTQAISLRQLLEKNGFEICGVLIGTSKRRKVPSFFLEKFSGIPVVQMQSPNFVTRKNRGIRIGATAWQNLRRIGAYLKSARLMQKKIAEWKPELVLNFYEPIAALYARITPKRKRLPIVCTAHQYLSDHPGFIYPEGHKADRLFLEAYTRFTASRADRLLALSFYETHDVPSKRIYIVPPLLRREVKLMEPANGDYLLCYLVNAGYRSDIEQWHKQHPDVKLHVFTDLASESPVMEIRPGLFFHQLSDTLFLEKMAGCKGLVSSAGFESVCEAFYLGKPVFMVPVEGHFEQLCNAHDAARAGAGIFDTQFDIGKFLSWLPRYESKAGTFREWESKAEMLFVRHLHEVLDAHTEPSSLTSELLPA